MPSLLNRRRASAGTVEPCFAVTDLGGGDAELVLYGDVMGDEPRDLWTGEPTGEQAVSTERINAELERLRGASRVTVRLNSCGGDAFAGIAIYNTLKGLDADITVRIEGIAASAASVIACAGDTVVAMPGSIFMVHDPACALFGFYGAADLELIKADLEATHRALCGIYAQKTGMDEASVEEMVRAETWLVGHEICDAGFADEYDSHEAADLDEVGEQDEEGAVINGVRHDMRAYRRVPDLAARVAASASAGPDRKQPTHTQEPPAAGADAAVANTEEPPQAAQERGEGPMDLTELRTQHPDLVAEIEAAAAKQERDRIAAIDEIAPGIPADMVADAKYANPVSAEALAFRAMKADAERAAAYMRDAKEDAEESGAEGVETDPEKDDDPEAAKRKECAEAAAYAAGVVNKLNGKEVR